MKEFWNRRYHENQWVYGEEPNYYFKKFIDSHKPGSILIPADGEGRNSVYAAKKGWKVEAFDFSEVARKKALDFAAGKKLKIKYDLKNIQDFKAGMKYDAVALIYVHLPEAVRKEFHKEIYKSIKPGGFLVFEAFTKEQLEYESGGPKDETLLYDAPAICSDFPFLHLISCEEIVTQLNEGPFHKGNAALLRIIGQHI